MSQQYKKIQSLIQLILGFASIAFGLFVVQYDSPITLTVTLFFFGFIFLFASILDFVDFKINKK